MLPLLSGRLFAAPSWLKLGLLAVALGLPTIIVVVRYWSEPEPSDEEFVLRRRAAFALVALLVVSAVWMVGVVDLESQIPLETVTAGDEEVTRFDVSVRLPPGGSLRDLTPTGGRVKAFFPRPDNPRLYRLALWEPSVTNNIDLQVSWQLPAWRSVGDVQVSIVPVEESG